jgi:hypothetical protein
MTYRSIGDNFSAPRPYRNNWLGIMIVLLYVLTKVSKIESCQKSSVCQHNIRDSAFPRILFVGNPLSRAVPCISIQPCYMLC